MEKRGVTAIICPSTPNKEKKKRTNKKAERNALFTQSKLLTFTYLTPTHALRGGWNWQIDINSVNRTLIKTRLIPL